MLALRRQFSPRRSIFGVSELGSEFPGDRTIYANRSMPYPRYSDSAASGGGSYGGDGYGRRDAYGGQGGQVSKWVFTWIGGYCTTSNL